jgi:hypothetical protein
MHDRLERRSRRLVAKSQLIGDVEMNAALYLRRCAPSLLVRSFRGWRHPTMTDSLAQARTIIHDCLVTEFLAAHRRRRIDPKEPAADLEGYCRTFGVSASQR